jgi:AraC family transcriptional regulator
MHPLNCDLLKMGRRHISSPPQCSPIEPEHGTDENLLFAKTSLLIQKAVRTPPVIRWENSGQPRFAIESYVTAPPADFDALPMALIAIHYGKNFDGVVKTGDAVDNAARETFSSAPYRLIIFPSGAETHWEGPPGTFWCMIIYTSGLSQDALKRIIGNRRAPFQVRDNVLPVLSRQLLDVNKDKACLPPSRYFDSIVGAFVAQLEWLSCNDHGENIVRSPDSAINDTLLYIHSHLNEKLTIAELAALQKISPALLRRRFLEVVGSPVHRYIMKCRVERAYVLIEGSRLSLSQISAQCGFSSLGHMSATFSRILGVSPGVYRKVSARSPARNGFDQDD